MDSGSARKRSRTANSRRGHEFDSADRDVVYTEDWQGIPFDLRKMVDAETLALAIEQGDLAFEWRGAAQADPDTG